MWSKTGWRRIDARLGQPPCWGSDEASVQRYFDGALSGSSCDLDWYEGYDGAVPQALRHNGTGQASHAEFQSDAVPVLGFDDAIETYCRDVAGEAYAHDCVRASRNILLLFGSNVHNTGAGYNSCRNLEWQLCAATGKLPGQRSPTIIFAKAPKELDIKKGAKLNGRPLDRCGGYAPQGCWKGAYANDDIYFLEACLYSMVCANNDELFQVDAREPFHCRISRRGFRRLQEYLTRKG